MILMLQRDTTDRIMAHPGTKDYGVLSIMTRLFAEVKVLKKLSPQVFWPVPLVDSAIVKMTVNRHTYVDTIRDYQGFQDVVRSIYSSRRKTLSNSLLSLCASHGIKKNETRQDLVTILERVRSIRPESRGEELEIEKLIELSNEVSDYVSLQKKTLCNYHESSCRIKTQAIHNVPQT